MNTITDAVKYYKNNIDKYWKNEQYKWIALQHFKDHWIIDSDDFLSMLEESFSKAETLLSGGMYHPLKMLLHFAEFNPARVKGLFELLYNEDLPLIDRIQSFRNECDELLKEYVERTGNQKAKSHYQDLRALCVYLSFRYPDTYYLYKARMYKGFATNVGYQETSQSSDSDIKKLENFKKLCELVVDEIKKDPELISMQKERIAAAEGCFDDQSLHLLAQTIMFVYSGAYGDVNGGNDFEPQYDEYPVNITKEEWKSFLNDVEIPYHKGCMRVLKCFVDIGGTASSKKLSDIYKGHPTVYSSSVTNTCRRALRYFDIEPYSSEGAEFFPIAFMWKWADENDPGGIIYRMRDELMEALKEMDLDSIELEYKNKQNEDKTDNKSGVGLNTILYGPPGTGKTYNMAYYAVAICDNIPIDDVKDWDEEEVMDRYKTLKNMDRIDFTTFHQSYGYEEFIEGIRPVLQDEDEESEGLDYKIKSGVFKSFCERAGGKKYSGISGKIKENPVVWKISLEGAGDTPTKRDCFANNRIRIGWRDRDRHITDESECKSTKEKTILTYFEYFMEIGDIVAVLHDKNSIDAVGVITGEYEWLEDGGAYPRCRKVEWLAKGFEANIRELNSGKALTSSTVYRLDVDPNEIIKIAKEQNKSLGLQVEENKENYVFIIDEINRGNISKIFGELITLIEDTKRKGCNEETSAILPYSGKTFSVPDNVYILGTMNTADRSIALMDTALRRRFDFVEKMPEPSLLDDVEVKSGTVSVNIGKMLRVINDRIEFLFDREHTIGHAFFMKLRKEENQNVETLADIFKRSVVPLLQEYFYEDYEKIQLVLGDNGKEVEAYKFIKSIPVVPATIFKGHTKLEKSVCYSINEDAFKRIESYAGIFNEPSTATEKDAKDEDE